MSFRRMAGIVLAAAVACGAGLLLFGGTSAAAPPPPTPITLEATGMSSPRCPALPGAGLYHSVALTPATAVQFKRGALPAGATSESLTIKPAPNSSDPRSKSELATISTTGSTPITFSRSATYALTWQYKVVGPLGVAAVVATQTGKLAIAANAAACTVSVQLPVPSVSASAVPGPISSAINGAIGGVVSGANGALGPVTGVLPSLPAVPGLPSVPGLPGAPGGQLLRHCAAAGRPPARHQLQAHRADGRRSHRAQGLRQRQWPRRRLRAGGR